MQFGENKDLKNRILNERLPKITKETEFNDNQVSDNTIELMDIYFNCEEGEKKAKEKAIDLIYRQDKISLMAIDQELYNVINGIVDIRIEGRMDYKLTLYSDGRSNAELNMNGENQLATLLYTETLFKEQQEAILKKPKPSRDQNEKNLLKEINNALRGIQLFKRDTGRFLFNNYLEKQNNLPEEGS